MIVPRYWAEARAQQPRAQGRPQITVRRFGWSDTSEADAQAMAQIRADEALRELSAGKRLSRFEPRRGYNGARGVPIREEILEQHGDAVITRNSYGAHCLNVPDVIFADIDFVSVPGARFIAIHALLLLALAITAAATWHSGRVLFFSLFAVAALYYPVARLTWRLRMALFGGPEKRARARLAAFVRHHPDWHLRVYRTPAGLRVLVMSHVAVPSEPAVRQFFAALDVDPVYARMCAQQSCFRARLSPKPWRIGIAAHMKPRPGNWPVHPSRLPLRQAWVSDYERRALMFASCRFVEQLGASTVHPRAEKTRLLHDARCRATTALELA